MAAGREKSVQVFPLQSTQYLLGGRKEKKKTETACTQAPREKGKIEAFFVHNNHGRIREKGRKGGGALIFFLK